MADVFNNLNSVNVNGHTKERNGLTYLSWAWAWAEVKKRYPDASYSVWKDENNLPYVFDARTGYMVYTTVTIDGITHEMWLPVMDSANNAMKDVPYTYTVKNQYFKYAKIANDGRYYDKYGNEQKEYVEKTVDAATMFDINKAVMRCLTKNLAMFGLGLYIYADTDLPEVVEDEPVAKEPESVPEKKRPRAKAVASDPVVKEPVSDKITMEQRDEFLNLIKDNFPDKDTRNGAYKTVLNELGLSNLGDMPISALENAKKRVLAIANGEAV